MSVIRNVLIGTLTAICVVPPAQAGKITAAIKKAVKAAEREEKEIAEKAKSKTTTGDILSGNRLKIGGSNNNNTTTNASGSASNQDPQGGAVAPALSR